MEFGKMPIIRLIFKSFFIFFGFLCCAFFSVFLYVKNQDFAISQIEDKEFTSNIISLSNKYKSDYLEFLTDFKWDKVCSINAYGLIDRGDYDNIPSLTPEIKEKLKINIWTDVLFPSESDMAFIFIKNNEYIKLIKPSSNIVTLNSFPCTRKDKRPLIITSRAENDHITITIKQAVY
jgi:hypothetical protein